MPDIRIKDLTTTAAAPASDDFMEMDGATNAGRKLRAGLINEWDATRAFAPYVYSDGVTSNRGIVQTPGARGNLAGAAVASWVGWVEVPTTTTNSYVTQIQGSATAAPWTSVGTLAVFFEGYRPSLLIVMYGASPGTTNLRSVVHPTFRTLYAGQRVWLEIRFTKGSSAPVVRVNGADLSATFSANALTAGTVPDWLDSTLNSSFHLTARDWPLGTAPLGCWLNAHLTDAESESWRLTGRPPAWVSWGGDCVKPTTASWANNSNTSFDFDTFTGASATGFTATLDNTGRPYGFAVFNAAQTSLPFGRYRCTFTLASTGRALPKLGPNASGAGQATVIGQNTIFLDPIGSTIVPVFVGDPYAVSEGANAYNFTVSDFVCERVGALSLLKPQAIPVADDITTIGGNLGRLVGITGVTEDLFWRVSANTATNGNQQLLGGSILDSTRDVIDNIEQTPATGTPTTSIGSASGSLTTYKASGALSAGINPTTLVTRKLASNDVWVASNTTDTVRTTITGHRAA